MFIAAMNYFVVVKYGVNPFAPYAPTTLGPPVRFTASCWHTAYLAQPGGSALFPHTGQDEIPGPVFGVVEFFGTLTSAKGMGGNISHIGHLGD